MQLVLRLLRRFGKTLGLSWRWRPRYYAKPLHLYAILHGIKTKHNGILSITAARTLNLYH